MKAQEEHEGRAETEGVRLKHARLLARRGRFAEATEQLAEARARGECTEATALDLQARICAQQGLLLEAEACWRRAQSLDPANPAYADALGALRQTQRPFAAWQRTGAWAGAAALLLCLIGTLVAGHRAAARHQRVLLQRLTALEQRIGALHGAAAQTAAATARAFTTLATALDADAATRQTSAVLQQAVADLRSEMDRRQQEGGARQEQARAALCQAINARLRTEAERQQQAVEAGRLAADARQQARDEQLEAELRSLREARTTPPAAPVAEAAPAAEDRPPPPANW